MNIEFPSGFLKHMLESLALWSSFDIEVSASGDTWVDLHHVVEDSGIVLVRCAKSAFGDKVGIELAGCAYVPMDEALVRVVVDISGRPFFAMAGAWPEAVICGGDADFQVSLVEDFWMAFCVNAGITLHLDILRGRSSHHAIEASFKAVGKAMRYACRYEEGSGEGFRADKTDGMPRLMSRKGIIE